MSQDSQFAPTPDYGGAPAAPAAPTVGDELSAPPQMSPVARLGNIFFGPGEVFEDVRRSPRDWWLPFVVWLAVATAVGYAVQFRLGLTPDRIADAAIEMGLERQGKTMKDLDENARHAVEQQRTVTLMFVKFSPAVGVVWYAIYCSVGGLLYMVLLLLFQAKTTYLRSLSVVTYSNYATAVVQSLLNLVLAFLTNPDDLDMKTFLMKKGLLSASPAAFVSVTAHPVLYTFLSYFDVFSLGYLALAAIGLSVICVKRVKMGTALMIVVLPYLLMMIGSVVIASVTAR